MAKNIDGIVRKETSKNKNITIFPPKKKKIQFDTVVQSSSSFFSKKQIFFHKKIWYSGILFFVFIIATVFVIFYKNNAKTEKITFENSPAQDSIVSEKEVDQNFFHINVNTDAVSVDADIVEGENDEDLHKGVVHQKGSAFPSKYGGNVVLTGHRWYPGDGEFSKVFYDIDKLKIGDHITITYNDKKYIYEVTQREIIDPQETELLEHTKDSSLTVYTCHPAYNPTQRLVYRAKLVSIHEK